MNNIRDEFLKILKDNNSTELKDFLVANGKQPKPIAAVMFETKEKKDK